MQAATIHKRKEKKTMDRAAIATTRAQVYEALHEVYDPVLAVNILDLGLVYAVELNEEGSSWRRGTLVLVVHTARSCSSLSLLAGFLPGHLSTAALLFTPCGRTARPIRRLSPSPSHA
jgi:hypothetical protein